MAGTNGDVLCLEDLSVGMRFVSVTRDRAGLLVTSLQPRRSGREARLTIRQAWASFWSHLPEQVRSQARLKVSI